MVYDLFNVLLDADCQYFVEDGGGGMNTTVFEQQKKEKELNYSKICEQDYGIVCEPGFNVDSEKCL